MRQTMEDLGIDLAAIAIVSYGVYFRRYYRRDLLLAYVALNIGVFAVTAVLMDSTASVGLGLGLFGVLSIIRLRSDSITQEEIAYYFIALALGLITAISTSPAWLAPALAGALVLVMYVADHPRLTARSQRQTITLDRAYPDRAQLKAALERLLGGEVRHVVVLQLDLVVDTTVVDVRFKAGQRHLAGSDDVARARPIASARPAISSPTAVEEGAP
jgi:hypothetical protein